MSLEFLHSIYDNLTNPSDRICCKIEETQYSYSDFAASIGAIQGVLLPLESQHIGIVINNSMQCYASIIACWLSGKAYVPLNLDYPLDRLASIIEDAEISHILCSQDSVEVNPLQKHFTSINFHNNTQLPQKAVYLANIQSEDTAYILFTSGTTGKPKGVPISFGNLQAFAEGFDALGYEISSTDRFLQMFELTFDLSVMCFALPLSVGASFYTLPNKMIKTLALYHVLEENEITISLMVPSAINLLTPYLNDIELPSLRVSQFCGEALKTDLIKQWMPCIPNAVVENVYGPTEATIFCTTQQIPRSNPDSVSNLGIVNIGKGMKHVQTRISELGELCVAGPQITNGYLNNALQNEQKFFLHHSQQFYKTGDLVKPVEDGAIAYIGRIDDQVKIQGYRVEMIEVELALKRILPELDNTVLAFIDLQGQQQLAGFVKTETLNESEILDLISTVLPVYMVPQRLMCLSEFPLNTNGKLDKNALRALIVKQTQAL